MNQPDEMTEESKATEPIVPNETPEVSGGMTLEEKATLEKEERERKLNALQATLNTGHKPRQRTLTTDSAVSSLGDSPSAGGMSVFSRLYEEETAASRASRFTPRTRINRFGFASRTSTPTAASIAGQSQLSRPNSPRLDSLYQEGKETLRARNLSDREEAEQRMRRIEDALLKIPGEFTFRPQTKFNLVAQRRKWAREQKEREEEEARKKVPKTITAVSTFRSCSIMCSIVYCDCDCTNTCILLNFRRTTKNNP